MEDSVEVLILNQSEVERLITVKESLGVIDKLWKSIAEGQVTQAGMDDFSIDLKNRNTVIAPTACIRSMGVFGIKWVGRFVDRPPGTSLHYGVIVLNDIVTGKPLVIMDAQFITHVRTGVNAAIAGKYLAKKDSKVIAIIGCGAEARTHLEAFSALFNLNRVNIYDIKPEAMSALKRDMADKIPNLEIVPVGSPKEAVKNADIVCMITIANEPVVLESWIPRGCFVAGTAQFRDLDTKLAKTANKFVVGHNPIDKPRLFKNFPQLSKVISPDDIYAEMPEIVSGRKPGRETEDERILYIHVGSGALDVVTAHLVYSRAKERGVGTKVKLI